MHLLDHEVAADCDGDEPQELPHAGEVLLAGVSKQKVSPAADLDLHGVLFSGHFFCPNGL